MKDEKKEEKRNPWSLAGAIFIAVMFLGSTIGLVFFYSQDAQQTGLEEPNYSYNGFEFVQVQNGWQTSTTFGPLTTVNLPQQVKEVDCSECSTLNYNSLAGGKVYIISSSASENSGAAELVRNVPYASVQRACLPEDADKEECKDLPIRSCENATVQNKVVIFKEGKIQGEIEEEGVSRASKEKVSYKSSCLVLEGENLIKAADRAIYKAFGVMP